MVALNEAPHFGPVDPEMLARRELRLLGLVLDERKWGYARKGSWLRLLHRTHPVLHIQFCPEDEYRSYDASLWFCAGQVEPSRSLDRWIKGESTAVDDPDGWGNRVSHFRNRWLIINSLFSGEFTQEEVPARELFSEILNSFIYCQTMMGEAEEKVGLQLADKMDPRPLETLGEFTGMPGELEVAFET